MQCRWLPILLLGVSVGNGQLAAQSVLVAEDDRASCEALRYVRDLTITLAEVSHTPEGAPYCYVKGILPPAIQFHVQLPLPGQWNNRFLKWGDGGKDGDWISRTIVSLRGMPWPIAIPATTTALNQVHRLRITIGRPRSILATVRSI